MFLMPVLLLTVCVCVLGLAQQRTIFHLTPNVSATCWEALKKRHAMPSSRYAYTGFRVVVDSGSR